MTQPEEDWPQEEIPNEDTLFMRVHRSFVQEGELMPSVFRNHGEGMSTNWQKYCPTPEDSRRKARNPEDNGVIQLGAGPVRGIPLLVEHIPNRALNDRSHADVKGDKTAEARLKLLNIAGWAIRIG